MGSVTLSGGFTYTSRMSSALVDGSDYEFLTHYPLTNEGANDAAKVSRDLQDLETLGAAHASRHQNGGADEINVAGLSGLLADAQTPLAHTQAPATITFADTARLLGRGTTLGGAGEEMVLSSPAGLTFAWAAGTLAIGHTTDTVQIAHLGLGAAPGTRRIYSYSATLDAVNDAKTDATDKAAQWRAHANGATAPSIEISAFGTTYPGAAGGVDLKGTTALFGYNNPMFVGTRSGSQPLYIITEDVLAITVSGTTQAVSIAQTLSIGSVANGAGNFLTLSGAGVVNQRTAAETLSDIGAQAADADLTAIAGISVARGKLITGQGVSPAWAGLTVGTAGDILRTDGTDVAWASLSTAGIQPLDSDLTSLAALNPVAGDIYKAILVSGANSYALGQALNTNSTVEFGPVGHIDTGGDHWLYIQCGENLSVDRTLSIITGDSGRTLTISGNATVSQDVSNLGSPSFQNVTATDLYVRAPSIGVRDTGFDHYMYVQCGTNLTADRILTITPGDSARTITLSGNPTLDDWFDQSVKVAATPQFAAVLLSAGTVGSPALRFSVDGGTGWYRAAASAWSFASGGAEIFRLSAGGANLYTGSLTLAGSASMQTLSLVDTGVDHYCTIQMGSDLTANKTLTLTTGDANRTITLSGNPTLADWFDQSVKQAATPQFAAVLLSSTTQVVERVRLSGQEFYQGGNTSTDGIGLLIQVNRSGNRQLGIADTARLTQNSTNPTLNVRIGATNDTLIRALSTDGTTLLPLTLDGSSITLSPAVTCSSTLQSTGLSVGRALSAGIADFYSAAADCDVYCTTNATDKLAGYRAVSNSGRSLYMRTYGSAYAAGSTLGISRIGAAIIFADGCTGLAVGTTDATATTLSTNNTARLTIAAAGESTFSAKVEIVGSLHVNGDDGGKAGCVTFCDVADVAARSTGVGTILFDDSTNRNSAGFFKVYIGTSEYYVPVFSAIT